MTDSGATLGTYKDHPVVTSTVSIRNTGHGLEEAMEVDPVELEMGSTVYVVLECEVEKHRYDPLKDNPDDLQLVNMLKAGRATLVDLDLVRDALDEQSERIEQAKAAAEAAANHDDRQLRLEDDESIDEADPALAADAVEVLAEAEQDAFSRRRRTAELDAKSKDDLLELAGGLEITGRHQLTKSELVDEILDAEATGTS